MLETAVQDHPSDIEIWRRLASLRRRDGDLPGALTAVDSALGLAPLDFLALLVRADILEQLGDPQAGEAAGRAVAQCPSEGLPPMLGSAVDRARQTWQKHQEALETRLTAMIGSPDPRAQRFITNISRRTRAFHSDPTHFHYPGLVEQEFHDRANFPWLVAWEAATDVIAQEFADVVAAESAELVPYVQYGAGAPLAQWRELNNSRKWTSIHLIQRGQVVAANARHCPRTMELLEQFPQPQIDGCGANAMFSLLAPRTRIPPHTGVANFRLVCHLPLIVPPDCRFRVGASEREWRRGEGFVFDDTIEHEAVNDSDALRVVMIIDCWHPDVGPDERDTIARIVGAASMAETDL